MSLSTAHQQWLKSAVILLVMVASQIYGSSKYTSAGTITTYDGGLRFFDPRGIAFSPDGAYVYIVNSDYGTAHVNAAAVCAFSTSDNLYKGKYGTSAADNIDGPHGIAVNVEGGSTYMYVDNVGHGGGANGLIKYQINAADLVGGGAVTINQALVATALNPQGIAVHGSTVYLGSNAGQIQKFKTADLTADGADFNPAGAKGIAFDSRGILYAASGTTLGRYNATDGSALSAVPGTIADPYGVAVAPSGHILLVDSNRHDIIVYKANGLPAFTISDVGSFGGGAELTYVAVHPTTGRVYATSGGADSTVYMFDVPSFRPPGKVLQSLPKPLPPAVTEVISAKTANDPIYQAAVSDLTIRELIKAADQYVTSNHVPQYQTSINSNISVLNVVQSHLDLVQMHKVAPATVTGFEKSQNAMTQLGFMGAQQRIQKLSNFKNVAKPGKKADESDAIFANAPTISIFDPDHTSVWSQGVYSKTKTNAVDDLNANKGIVNSFTLGCDWEVGEQLRIGLLAGTSTTRVYVAGNGTHDSSKKIYTGIYAAQYWGKKNDLLLPTWDMSVIVGKGLSHHTRDVSIQNYPLIAKSKNTFWDILVRNRFSLPIKFSSDTTATPYISLGWMTIKEDKVHESEAQEFNQIRPGQQFNILEFGAGFQISTQFKQKFGMIVPTIRFGALATKPFRNKKWVKVGLEGGGSYDLEQRPLPTATFNVGGGLALQTNNNSSISASYMGSFNQKYKKHEIMAEIKFAF